MFPRFRNRSTPSAQNPRTARAADPERGITTDAEVERELVARIRAGDRAAFGVLVERHVVRALGLGFRLLHHAEDAEDLVQDAFLTALEHIDAFDGRRAFWPWLARIIVNRGLDLARARSVRVTEPLPDALADGSQSPLEAAARREMFARFRHELALLPPRQQLVLQLVELDGYSVAEVAAMLDSSPSTVRWHLHTGRHRLRDVLSLFRGDGR